MRLKLHWQILIALVLAIPAGLLAREELFFPGLPLVPVYDFLGTLFLNALKMIIVPLVTSAVITGIAGVGAKALGRLGGKTIVYYLATSLIAIVIGLVLVNITEPGYANGEPAKDVLGLSVDTSTVAERVEDKGAGDIWQVFLRMVPVNIIAAAADNGQLLGLIFFSILFGFFITRLEGRPGEVMVSFWEGIYQIMLGLTNLIMRTAPIGVLALVAQQVAIGELAGIANVAVFFFTVLAALLVHMFIVLPAVVGLVGRVNPIAMFSATTSAMLTAFSTSSSSATIPVTMECVQDNAGVSQQTASFVIPLGATVNMNGTALYECVAAMFIAQAYGLDLSLVTQFVIVITALLTSIGVAGIPSASLVAIAVILGVIGLPAEGLGLILAVDRILDMFRTAVNVFGDACGAVVVARLEGETGLLTGSGHDFETSVERVSDDFAHS